MLSKPDNDTQQILIRGYFGARIRPILAGEEDRQALALFPKFRGGGGGPKHVFAQLWGLYRQDHGSGSGIFPTKYLPPSLTRSCQANISGLTKR